MKISVTKYLCLVIMGNFQYLNEQMVLQYQVQSESEQRF